MSNPNDRSGSGQPGPDEPAARPGGPPTGFEPSPYAPRSYGSGHPAWGGTSPGAADPLVSRDFAGWCQRGTALAKAAWRPLLTLQLIQLAVLAVVAIPVLIYGSTVIGPVFRAFRDAAPGVRPAFNIRPATTITLVALGVAAGLIGALVTMTVQVASFRVVIATAGAGDRLTAGQALRGALPRLLPSIGWYLLAAPIYLIGFVACFLPVLYVTAALFVLPVIVAVERTNAIGRSFSLFHASPGPALGRIVSIFALGMVESTATNTVAQVALGGMLPTQPGQQFGLAEATGPLIGAAVGLILLSAVLRAVMALLTIPLTVLTYTDLRGRVEPDTTTARIRADLQLSTV
jgi:hypothetical protein